MEKRESGIMSEKTSDTQDHVKGPGRLIFLGLLSVCVLIVVFFGFAGPTIMNLLARHDPDPVLRARAATLRSLKDVMENGLDVEVNEADLLARDHGKGPGRINCVIMGAKAEKAGRFAEAYLWFALDARARGMSEAVKAYEDEALRLAGASATGERSSALGQILNNYEALVVKLDAEAK